MRNPKHFCNFLPSPFLYLPNDKAMKQLLLLAVFLLLARCQAEPQVYMSPQLKQIFTGDVFYLTCNDSSIGETVKWFFNGTEQNPKTKTSIFPAASGSYECEINGQRSKGFSINVLDFTPSASLTIATGLPVVRNNGSIVLLLESEEGLTGWQCWVYKEGRTRKIKLMLKSNDSVAFAPKRLVNQDAIYWCTDENQERRSNQRRIVTSAKGTLLEMNPFPAVVGESVTLTCHVWGGGIISHAVFYKDNTVIMESGTPTHKIPKVTESETGKYKCDATYKQRAATEGTPYQEASDSQYLFVQAPPVRAVLSKGAILSCSCPNGPESASYNWYRKVGEKKWSRVQQDQSFMMPMEGGTYACAAVWKGMRSLLSLEYTYESPIKTILSIGIFLVILLIVAVVVFCLLRRRRLNSARIYEDLPLADKGGYGQLKRGKEREADYDTLHPEVSGKPIQGGDYQGLNRDEMKDTPYDTLKMEEGAGGYEALKKEGMKDGVYHTLGGEEAAGGAGGYEALKKEGMKDGVYHTLGGEEAAGGAGGYEALKKEGMKDGVYHTLGETTTTAEVEVK